MKRILIVEDDIDLCLALSDFLGEFGFETAVADDGVRALRILGEADPLPDAILLDLRMPNMDGWALRAKLADHPRYCNIPIVVMSADKGLNEVPADAHLAKPFDMGAAMNILRALVN